MATIKLKNIVKRFGNTVAVNDVSLEIMDKEFLVLLGPSGCGKTTTLRSIAGLETIDEGEIWIEDRLVNNIRASERDIAFVFQLYALYPHLTVYQNISFPLRAQRTPRREIKDRVMEAAKLLKIEHILGRKPRALSGGDLQRVALGRALVRRPKAFLMDEPMGTLDTHFREKMRTELRRLHLDIEATTVYVTHDQIEAMSMGDRIAIMNQGVLQQLGTPIEVYNNPANIFVANFIGSPGMNFADCKYTRQDGKIGIQFISSGVFVEIPQALVQKMYKKEMGENLLVLGVRFEDMIVQLKQTDGFLPGEVYVFEKTGSYNIIDVKIGEDIIKAKAPSSFKPGFGEKIWFKMKMERIHLFEKKSGLAIF